MSKVEEIWKDVVGYEGIYKVSNYGNLISVKKNKRMSLCQNLGYPRVSLCNEGRKNNVNVHVMVMAAFVGKREEGIVINHINGIRSDNRLCNLEYCTQSHNCSWEFQSGRRSLKGEKNTQSKLTESQVLEIVEIRKVNKTPYRQLAPMYDVHFTCISNIFNGHNWSYLTGIPRRW